MNSFFGIDVFVSALVVYDLVSRGSVHPYLGPLSLREHLGHTI
jgi:hypothetical protein